MAAFSSCVMVVAGLLAARAPAPPADADALIAKGVELRRTNNNVEALELFRRAHALAPSGRTLAQMGFAEVVLKRWLDAEQHLSDANRAGDSYAAKNRKLVDQQLADARTHIGTLQITGPAGAAVLIDGRQAGTLPLAAPLRLAEGAVTLSATAPGFMAADRKLTVEGGKEQAIVLALTPVAPAAPALIAAAPEPHATAIDGGGRRWLVGGLAVGALAGVATGATLLYLDGRTSCDTKKGPACPTVYTTGTAGLVAAGAGAAAGIAAGVVYWRTRESGVAIAPTLSGVALAGRF